MPSGKSIHLYFIDIKLYARDSDNNCGQEFVRVMDSTGTYVHCGYEKPVFFNTFCSSLIYINFQTGPIGTGNRGFKLYYETFDTAALVCPQGPLTTNTASTLTTTPPTLPVLTNLQASGTFRFQVCSRDPPVTIKAPAYYAVYIEKLVHGVTTSGQCDPHETSHCTVPAQVQCNLKEECSYVYKNDRLAECGNQIPSYLYGEYRLIPKDSTSKYQVGDILTLDLDEKLFGVITSKKYPEWEPAVEYTMKLITRDPTKAMRIYVVDLNIEDDTIYNPDCSNTRLQFNDGVSDFACLIQLAKGE